jgi:hypothetical protein
LWVIFALLDPDSESGSGSTDPIEPGSDPNPQVRNPGILLVFSDSRRNNVCAVAEDAHEKLAVADAKLGNAIQVSCKL